ncbi:MAG: DegT/DnrJ/EryC1/StrS family aminotransferase, partial [Nitrospirota bacterium]|nr:DegT/DnrJ/EryC1/StrS family aminotransferase [Nitrospirota bacterium]
IMAVDFAGHPCRMHEFKQLADRHGLILIEDAAHALGATYDGRRVGQLADMTTFSFHPVKVLTTGEGGMVVTDRKDLYQRLQLFRNHGITRDPWLLRTSNPAPWFYEQQELGYNYRLTDIQAALGLSQLERLSHFIARRRAIAARYQASLSDLGGIRLPAEREWAGSAWHLFVVRLNLPLLRKTRRDVFEELRARGIGVQVHYIPVYAHPYYQRFQRYQRCFTTCPRAERFYAESISLPLFPKMADEDIERVIGVVREVMHEASRDRD